MRVLVIDDEVDIAEIVRLTFGLRWPGAEVVTASTGEQGVDLVEREAPDLVLLDIGLPDIDGVEVCERIRHFSDVPIVMLSARHEEVDKVRGLALGADDYVTKPFSHLRRKLGDDPQNEPMIANERGVRYKFVRKQRADAGRKAVR